MDTNVIDGTVVEPDIARVSIRLPGEPDDVPLEGAGAAPASGKPSSAAGRLQSGVQRLVSRLAISPHKGLPVLATLSPGRRKTLLIGGSALALAAAAAGGLFLVVHGNPRVATTVGSVAASAGLRPQQPLAPAAALAKVELKPSAGTVVRPTYTPPPKDQQVAEVLSLHAGPSGPPASAQPKPPAVAATLPRQTPSAEPPLPGPGDVDKPPPGYVPSEPGTPPTPAAQAAPAAVQPAAAARTDVSPVQAPAAATPAPAQSLVGSVLAAFQSAEPPVVSHSDVVKVAQDLRAAPMTPAEQVQVLGLVTEMAAIVHDLREQEAQLRGDLQKTTADATTRLADFERRIALAEARSAVGAARDAGATPSSSAPVATPARPVVLTRAEAALPDTGTAKRYRVQAASPGLALLAEVDRGGGDGAQMQVTVGESIPGYGTVKSIGQKGTGWVVTTERGVIQ
jgi:hypothetical protein